MLFQLAVQTSLRLGIRAEAASVPEASLHFQVQELSLAWLDSADCHFVEAIYMRVIYRRVVPIVLPIRTPVRPLKCRFGKERIRETTCLQLPTCIGLLRLQQQQQQKQQKQRRQQQQQPATKPTMSRAQRLAACFGKHLFQRLWVLRGLKCVRISMGFKLYRA